MPFQTNTAARFSSSSDTTLKNEPLEFEETFSSEKSVLNLALERNNPSRSTMSASRSDDTLYSDEARYLYHLDSPSSAIISSSNHLSSIFLQRDSTSDCSSSSRHSSLLNDTTNCSAVYSPLSSPSLPPYIENDKLPLTHPLFSRFLTPWRRYLKFLWIGRFSTFFVRGLAMALGVYLVDRWVFLGSISFK